ncbi:MAG: (5-formylfuran-3-yl)methyl phosphate synthase [Gemmataceae bacterium]
MTLNQQTPQKPHRTRLLVSVRSAHEAELALLGGADVIDIKEPANGPLGKTSWQVVEEIVRVVQGRVPVTAAMGELYDHYRNPPRSTDRTWLSSPNHLYKKLWLLKWGLSGGFDWQGALQAVIRKAETVEGSPGVVAVAYAEGNKAMAPEVQHVVEFACSRPGSILLIDTFHKSSRTEADIEDSSNSLGRGLLSWLPKSRLVAICAQCHASGVRVALAGSLRLDDIADLMDVRPDWVAVRGAACTGDRDSSISEVKVRQLANVVHSAKYQSEEVPIPGN